MIEHFDFPYGEHFTAVGSTGAGKTELVKSAILPRRRRFIIVDSKARRDGTSLDFQEKAFKKCSVKTAVRLAHGDKNFRLRIPLPSGDAGFDLVEELADGLLKHARKSGAKLLVYFDEVTDVSDAWTVGPMLEGLVRKGRGYEISVGCGSQKPKGVNGWFMDNSAHTYFFAMKPEDQVRFVKNTGMDRLLEVQPKIAPVGSYKFAHEDWQGTFTIYNPVPLYDWGAVE